MRRKRLETKGWLNDVLTCVKEMYGFEDRPHALHSDNKHVKDKIRQQMLRE